MKHPTPFLSLKLLTHARSACYWVSFGTATPAALGLLLRRQQLHRSMCIAASTKKTQLKIRNTTIKQINKMIDRFRSSGSIENCSNTATPSAYGQTAPAGHTRSASWKTVIANDVKTNLKGDVQCNHTK
mmetsp:Transcript_114460/g.309168  ORF Transcript_114460/g.309168 Transcript_114460/m.309168 type:complete len:129 (-) Transcript_114460:180-566(-)